VNSSVIHERVRDTYGIDAEVLHPPPALGVEGQRRPIPGLEPGYVLCVSRLVEYKNARAAVDAFAGLPDARLVVVGEGPQRSEIERTAPPNVRVLGTVTDPELRWLYGECAALVAPAYEDFGLTPVEAAAFGKPTLALRYGGYLDTVRDGRTGLFFDRPTPDAISGAVARFATRDWDPDVLHAHAESFGENRFAERMREVVSEEAGRAGLALEPR
jgi:glycosyltransferase involved in cell wall biosynthesis